MSSGGWVFCADPDDDVRKWLRPGVQHLWESARSVGKEAGQHVLFLLENPRSSAWLGSGEIVELEERWKMFGVVVECKKRLPHPLPSLPTLQERAGRPEATNLIKAGASPWENRDLATRIGLSGFRSRTPSAEWAADLLLSPEDLERLLVLRPALKNLMLLHAPRPR